MTNTQTVKEIYARFGAGNIPGVLELFHPQISWKIVGPEGYPFFGTFHGHEGFQAFLRGLTEATEITRFEPLRFMEAGDAVVVTGNEEARIRKNRVPYSTSWCHIFTLRDGLLVSFEEYLDSAPIASAFDAASSATGA